MWEEKQKVCVDYLESSGMNGQPRRARSEGNGISIKWNPAHHITRTGIPRIIFP